MHLVFARKPGESYCRGLGSLLLYLCDSFWVLINSLVGWFFQNWKIPFFAFHYTTKWLYFKTLKYVREKCCCLFTITKIYNCDFPQTNMAPTCFCLCACQSFTEAHQVCFSCVFCTFVWFVAGGGRNGQSQAKKETALGVSL